MSTEPIFLTVCIDGQCPIFPKPHLQVRRSDVLCLSRDCIWHRADQDHYKHEEGGAIYGIFGKVDYCPEDGLTAKAELKVPERQS